jgi:SAM-dependent methyltransferase
MTTKIDRFFTKSARFYDAIYGFKDYEEAARKLRELALGKVPDARALLDVGCGTGQHLGYLQKHYAVAGLDVSAELLAVARERLPDVPLLQADMVDFSFGRRFDIVTCLFSAIAYVETLERMRAAVANMAAHLNPGGVLVVEPWVYPKRYRTGTITANHVDQPDLKISWMYTSEQQGQVSVLDIHYLVGTPERVEYFTEGHRMGLFTHDEYLDAFRSADLNVSYDPEGLFGRGVYVACAPSALKGT